MKYIQIVIGLNFKYKYYGNLKVINLLKINHKNIN